MLGGHTTTTTYSSFIPLVYSVFYFASFVHVHVYYHYLLPVFIMSPLRISSTGRVNTNGCHVTV